MLKGYAGKIAWIDLSEKTDRAIDLDEDLARKFLGGKGLGAYLLYKHLPPDTPPYDPANLLIFVTGPLTGTAFPAVSRSGVVTKSPLTGTFMDSYSGSYFGPHMKYAGFDALIISGRSEKLSYIFVNGEEISVRDATHLKGMSCLKTEAVLKEELGEGKRDRISVAAIGEAGEKQVRFANIISERRAYGRGGSGAVMGSKNLKAIAIRGEKEPEIADDVLFKKIIRACRRKIADHPIVGKKGSFRKVGTMHTIDVTQETGSLPSKNWQENTSEQAISIGAEALEKYIIRPRACFGCPIACSRDTKALIKDSEFITEGPEYETLYSFGANCDIDDPGVVIAADRLCAEYGVDTISCGVVIGFAMECFERGLITPGDTEGLDLKFGNGEALLETIHRICKKTGIGRLLSEGVKRASEKIDGSQSLAIHVKGLELPGYDPRAMKGQSLTYALSDRGGCHLRSNTLRTELLGLPVPINRYTYEKKAEMVREMQLKAVLNNSIIACFFCTFAVSPEDYAEALSAAVGWSLTSEELRTIAERTWNLTRLFNVREGFGKEDDTLPERLFTQASSRGPSKGEIVDRDSFQRMLEEYYQAAGWEKDSGVPTEEKLRALGLHENI